MKKVILFGGSFDPIHYGHLNMAQQALKQQKADELWFIPNQVSPFKSEPGHFEQRCKMIEMMISAQPKMKVSKIDQHLPKPSYSMNSIDALKKLHPEYEFSWLIGDDQLDKLHLWYEFDRLDKEIDFIVYSRVHREHKYEVIVGDVMNVSSTAIRQGTQRMTKPGILEYMMREGLYLDEMAHHRLSEFRYQHTLRVCDLALEIAQYYPVDLKKVRLAAMMHDYCKEHFDDVSFIRSDVPHAYYHGFAAASLLSKHYYIKDRDVLRAIYGHVSGSSTNLIGMILYIADKCERGRGYDTEPWITRAKQDLRTTFKQLKLFTDEYRKKA